MSRRDVVLFVRRRHRRRHRRRRGRRQGAARARKPVILVGQQGRRRAQRGRCRDAVVARPRRAVRRCRRSTVAGRGELLDAVVAALPETTGSRTATPRGPRRVALLGKPNVGKSSLLNQARRGASASSSTRRRHHASTPSTSSSSIAGVTWRFVDTAGIRRRVQRGQRARVLRVAAHRRPRSSKAEVAVVLLEATSRSPSRTPGSCRWSIESGPRLVLAYNKWDLVDEERRKYLEREIERDLIAVHWAPRVNVSARTGRHMEKFVPALETALAGWETRIPTGRAQRVPRRRSSRRTRTPCAAASSPRSCSARRPASGRRRSSCSPPACSRPATAASSSAGCARSSASRGLRCGSTCACGRSDRASSRPSRRRGR